MTHLANTGDDKQPRPVVNASRLLGALSLVLGVVPVAGSAFFGWEWSADQVEAYTVVVGTFISAIALAFGVRVEREVTPTSNPRDDGLAPLVPTANDGFED